VLVVLSVVLFGCLDAAPIQYGDVVGDSVVAEDTVELVDSPPQLDGEIHLEIPDTGCNGTPAEPYWVRIRMKTRTYVRITYGISSENLMNPAGVPLDREFLVDRKNPAEVLIESGGCTFEVEVTNHDGVVSDLEFEASEKAALTVWYGIGSDTFLADGYQPQKLPPQVGYEKYYFHGHGLRE